MRIFKISMITVTSRSVVSVQAICFEMKQLVSWCLIQWISHCNLSIMFWKYSLKIINSGSSNNTKFKENTIEYFPIK